MLLLFGSDSHLKADNMNEIQSHFRDIRYVEMEGAGHNLHLDQPEACIAEFEKHF